jgi:hypothetical protein
MLMIAAAGKANPERCYSSLYHHISQVALLFPDRISAMRPISLDAR